MKFELLQTGHTDTSIIWKAIPGFPGYEVSSTGAVRSFLLTSGVIGETFKILKIDYDQDNYGFVRLSIGKGRSRRHKIGKLALFAFVGPRPANHQVSHLNGISSDDRIENLCWETARQNNLRKRDHGTLNFGEKNGNAFLTEKQVAVIKKLKDVVSIEDLASLVKCSKGAIKLINSGRTWRHI